MSKKRIFKPLGVLFFSIAVLIFTVAGASADVTDLTDWEGSWTSSYSYLDSSHMNAVYEAVADEITGYDAGDVKDFLSAMLRTDFTSMTVTASTITIDSAAAAEYTYQGITNGSWGAYDVTWYSFEKQSAAVDDPFKYIIVTAVHQDSADSMNHYHLRYGTTGFEDLGTNASYASWWPTLVESSLTEQEVAQEYLAMKDEFVAMLSPVPVPGSIFILYTGLIAVLGLKRKRQM